MFTANHSEQTPLCLLDSDLDSSPCFQHSRASFPAQLPGLNFSRPLLFFTEEWLCNIRLSHTRLSTNQRPQTLPCNRYQATRPALVHQHTEASILLKPSAARIVSPVETSSLAGESAWIRRRLLTTSGTNMFLYFTRFLFSIISFHLFMRSHLREVNASVFPFLCFYQ